MNITEHRINLKKILKTQVYWRFLLALLLYPVTYILSSNGLIKIQFLSNFLYSISTVIVIYSIYLIYFQLKCKNLFLICGSNNKNFIKVLFNLFISIYTLYAVTLIFAVLYYFFKINEYLTINIFMIFILGMLMFSALKFDNLNNAFIQDSFISINEYESFKTYYIEKKINKDDLDFFSEK